MCKKKLSIKDEALQDPNTIYLPVGCDSYFPQAELDGGNVYLQF